MKAVHPIWQGHRDQIHEILILNLKYRPDRYYSVYGALHAAGTPVEKIKRWNAIPASDYKDTEALVAAAVKDGFPEFQTLLENEKFSPRLAKTAQFWSYCQLLRYIAEKNITAVVLYDDWYIINWSQFSSVYSCMKEIEENPDVDVVFDVLQLGYHHDYTHKIVNLYANPDKFSRPYPSMPYILQGPLGTSEAAMLYTPEGAKFFLEKLLNTFRDTVEVPLAGLIQLPIEERAGVWTCNYPAVAVMSEMGSNVYNDNIDQTDKLTVGGIR